MSADKTVILFTRSGQAFLDPEEVGSAIQYRINVKETNYVSGSLFAHRNASISLSDCSRWITWDLESDTAQAKLDQAIAILKQAKIDLRRADAIFADAEKRVAAWNKAKK